MSVAVVTDSTACLPAELRDRYDITVVPIPVTVNGVTGEEGIDFTPADMATAFAARRVEVSTSRPAPETLANVYQDLLDSGHTGVLSVHLSSKLSGTVDSATQAAAAIGDRVHVVDSLDAGMGLGFCALAAATEATKGRSLSHAATVATQTKHRTHTYFYVDTLEFLRRGGRISAASALVGTALAVKPILNIDDGKVIVRDKVRTSARALARLRELITRSAGEGSIDIALHHFDSPEQTDELGAWAREAFGRRLKRLFVTEVGAVVAAHCGPGLLGAVVHRRL
ncbi:DegV family protein [Stackebrandtia soli]|uniref:DegV family protein n=1 Tax=Stackebrandtia soli TaxID=1892856 RepID=UPI0039ED83B4